MPSRNRNIHLLTCAVAGLALLAATGCPAKSNSNEKQVFKIKGTVTVDGVPTPGIQIALHDKAGLDKLQPTFPQGFTDDNGNIRISTYEDGDGAPVGDYKITFALQEFNMMSRAYAGPDKLNKKYSDPKKTPFSLTLGPGQPNDLGTVELTTKK